MLTCLAASLALAGSAVASAQDEAQEPAQAPAAVEEADVPCPDIAEDEGAFVMPSTGFAFTLPTGDEADRVPGHCAPPLPPMPVRPPAPSLFSMVALPLALQSDRMEKWDSVRQTDLGARTGPWNEVLSPPNREAAMDPLQRVNMWVNWNVRYENDRFGDEWSSAPATLSRGYGDCEDFALAKMALLAELGVPPDDMYLVLLKDRAREDHAVLAVRRGDDLLVLDNRTDVVLPAARVHDYTPIVSYSGAFAWTYGAAAR